MGPSLATFLVAVEIAFRNLFASRWKTLIVGGIIASGAAFIVVSTALVDGVDRAMRGSVTRSVTGHIQVFSNKSSDELEILGTVSGGLSNLEPLDNFARIKRTLLSLPNVAAVVPMGTGGAVVSGGNTIDQALAGLRSLANARLRGDTSPELVREYAALKAHVAQIARNLRRELENAKRVSDRSFSDDERHALDRAASDDFWSDFDANPLEHLEVLENRVTTFTSDADVMNLRYVGTDPQVYAKAFDGMRIVDGEAIPAGKRGFLFSKYMYEEFVKLKAARGLDKLKHAVDEQGLTIAKDPDLQRIVRTNTTGVTELVLQLDPVKTQRFRGKLQAFLHSDDSDVGGLLAAFFATDDANLHERYRFFYAQLAPDLDMYRVRVGDTLTLKAFTRSGYIQSANLKVYGTYTFKGLEQSPQAGLLNMMDLVSFRELYGFMTPEREQELAALSAAAGAEYVARDAAEAELFARKSSDDPHSTSPNHEGAQRKPDAVDDVLSELRGTRTRKENTDSAPYDPSQLEDGTVLNAAVLLKDERKIPETIAAIEQAGKRAALPLKAVSWQSAAGVLGQFSATMQAVLFAATLVIFVVGLVVVNNALVMATLERVHEIGTLRALGAQRRFILAMILLESVVIGLSTGTLGAVVGALLVLVLGRVGIPAGSEAMTFFFSGWRLFPTIGLSQVFAAISTVMILSAISGVYPAWLAMRVSPREAMQSEE